MDKLERDFVEGQAAINRTILSALQAVHDVNTTVAAGFRSLALQADKYDAEIAELREDIAGLAARIDRLWALTQHSARVDL